MSSPTASVGRVGIYTFDLSYHPMAEVLSMARELEELGFQSLYFPEVEGGREAIGLAATILGATERIVVANAIARVDKRTPQAARAAVETLSDAFPGRYIMGLGYGPARHDGSDPLDVMRQYAEAMVDAPPASPPLEQAYQLMFAGYGPKMLRLGAELAGAVHPYKVTVSHTKQARELLGDKPFVTVEQGVILETDPEEARRIARLHLDVYLRTLYNRGKFKRLGYTVEDLADGGSDRIVDDLVAWGSLDAIGDRIQEHFDAGANHVAVQVVGEHPAESRRADWRALADLVVERFS